MKLADMTPQNLAKATEEEVHMAWLRLSQWQRAAADKGRNEEKFVKAALWVWDEYKRRGWDIDQEKPLAKAVLEKKAALNLKRLSIEKPLLAGYTDIFSVKDMWTWCQKKLADNSKLTGEVRLDGIRCIISKSEDHVSIWFEDSSENRAEEMPDIVEAVKKSPFKRIMLDGEIVMAQRPAGFFVAFDCLLLDDQDMRSRPLEERHRVALNAVQQIDSPLVQASSSRRFSTEKELEIVGRWAASQPLSKGLAVKDLTKPYCPGSSDNWAQLIRLDVSAWGPIGAPIAFVAARPCQMEKARDEPLIGPAGEIFKRLYLEPLGLEKSHVAILYLIPQVQKDLAGSRRLSLEETVAWNPWLMKELSRINPRVIVALGRQAADALEGLADFSMPHPGAVLKYGDSGEVGRKLRQIAGRLHDSDSNVIAERDYHAAIFKADAEKRLVFGVVSEPLTVDAQGDVLSEGEIEQFAHKFLVKIREFRDRHTRKKVEADIVESWIAKADFEWMGQIVKKGSWIVGVHVLDDEIWGKIKAGFYKAFSIGGRGLRVRRVRFD